MKIGVTGAYGFLGASFVARCAAENASSPTDSGMRPEKLEITAFYARNSTHPLVDPALVRSLPLDVRDYASCERAFAGLDAVVHFSGMVEFSRRRSMEAWIVNAIGTDNVLRAAKKAGVRRFVHISSISVLGACGGERPADEDNDPFAPASAAPTVFRSWDEAADSVERSKAGDSGFVRGFRVPYIDTKIAAEGVARRYAAEGMDVVIAYPGTVVGPGDVHDAIGKLLYKISTGGMPGASSGASSYVDSRDFADGVLKVLLGAKPGSRYVISGRAEWNMNYREFFSFVAARSGRPGFKPLVLPLPVTYALGAIAELVAPRSGLSRGLVISGSVDQRFSSRRAMGELGYDPATDLGKSVDDCLAYYLAHHTK